MKKLFLAICLVLSISSIKAQETQEIISQNLIKTINFTKVFFKKMKYGVKEGVDFSTITGINNITHTESIGIGCYGRYILNLNSSIQPEISLSYHGIKKYKSIRKLSNLYLNIPILFQYRIVDDFFIEIGPKFGFIIKKGNYKLTKSFSLINKNIFDIGLAFGAKYSIEKYINYLKGIELGVRYVIGITNVYDHKSIYSNKNLLFQAGINYMF